MGALHQGRVGWRDTNEGQSNTYTHRLTGDCHCGTRHYPTPPEQHPCGDGQQARGIVALYDYTDENGTLLCQTVRYDPKDFSQRRPYGHGGWILNLKGVRRVLYRLPELLAADPAKPVFVCEDEKGADNLNRLGLVSTTNPMGAKKWLPEYSGFLKDRQVVILPDKDKDGYAHAQQVAKSLQGIAPSIRVLELPGLEERGDFSDWLDQGHTAQELMELARKMAEWVPSEAERQTGVPFRSAAQIVLETPSAVP